MADDGVARELEIAQAIAHVGSWHWVLATGKVRWSAELYRIYGLEVDSRPITFEVFLELVYPEDRELVRSEIEAAMRDRGQFHYRERIVRPDGVMRTLDTNGEVTLDADGKVSGLIGTCRDITDEVRQLATVRFYSQVLDRVEIGVSAWLVHGDPPRLRLVTNNPATERITGISLADRVGVPIDELLPALAAIVTPAATQELAATAVQDLGAVRLGMSDDARVLSVRMFALPSHHVGLALEDITVSYRLQQVRAGEQRALEMLASNHPLGEILEVIVKAIETVLPETIASIVLVSEDGKHLRHGSAPRLPDELNRAIHGAPVGPTLGSCGSAVFARAPIYSADIGTDARWADYVELTLPYGLRACWSFPIIAPDGRVLGTFALYKRAPGQPDQVAIDLMQRAAHVAGIAIERRELDDELRALATRIEAIREDERTTIARDVHDQLGQAMTALKLDVAWLARRIEDPLLTRKLDDMSKATDDLIGVVRRISTDLRPGILDDAGLLAAIEWQAEEFTRRTGIACTINSTIGDITFERSFATMAFRIFQEALTNVTRHASATRVDVTIGLDRGRLRLAISDDGIGVPEIGPRGTTLGILGMGERARRLGGECTVKRRSPHGTTVLLVAPLRFPADVGAP